MSQAKSLREVNIQLKARKKNKAHLTRYGSLVEKGDIVTLEHSPVYAFVLNGVEIGTLEAAVELTYADGRREAIIEPSSPEQAIMAKLLKAFYDIDAVIGKA